MFLQQSIVIGNLLIKLIHKEIFQISFFDIYNFFYYVHGYLSQNSTAAMVICSKDDIFQFINNYSGKLRVYSEKIDIIQDLDLLNDLTDKYKISEKITLEAFDFSFSHIFKNELVAQN